MIGYYTFEESSEFIKPNVTLEEENRFSFTYSVLSSYIAVGVYEIDGNNLILKTSDGENEYVFEIIKGSLVFNVEKSSQIPSFANLPDGAIFKNGPRIE